MMPTLFGNDEWNARANAECPGIPVRVHPSEIRAYSETRRIGLTTSPAAESSRACSISPNS